jgi:ketosteroid isomerase-like protein
MKYLLLAIILVSSYVTFSQASEAAKIHNVIRTVFDGLAERDVRKIFDNCTEDIVILEHGELWNTDSITVNLDRIKNLDFKRNNFLEFIKTEVNGNTGWVYYNNRAEITVNGRLQKIAWLESAVLVKKGEAWKLKLLHSTVVNHD